jgi:S1-C subfamily serine protease
MKLLVRDVRSGRDVPVDVAWNTDDMSAPTGGAGRSLGVKTELAFFGGKPVLKVTGVENGSPAKQSGISPGMLILSAGGIAASSPEKLEQVVSQAGNSMDLEIVADPATGQSRNVRVRLR